MKVAVILNGVSRKKKKFYRDIYPVISAHFEVSVFETQYSGHAQQLAIDASQGYDVILSAGGDGTLHQVINGILKSGHSHLPVVGIIPLGTGNDFARLCGYRPEGSWIVQLLKRNSFRTIDVGNIVCRNKEGEPVTEYFLNACSVGMGPVVVEQLSRSSRWMGPQLTYLSSILVAFFSQHSATFHCKADSWEWRGRARVIVFANGRSFGNEIYIAPEALCNDGILNSFIATDMPLLRFLYCLLRIKAGRKLKDPHFFYNVFQRAELLAEESTLLEAEGEMVGYLPATISVMAGRLSFL